MIRGLIVIAALGGLAYCGATVELGQRTFFGHVAQIWSTDETQELVEGVKETGAPMVERIKRGVRAGVEEARRDPFGEKPDTPQPEAPDAAGDADGDIAPRERSQSALP